MPKNHARKKALADLKDELGIRHACAIALLDHPDSDDRDILVEFLATYSDINTYREAVDYLTRQRNDPRNQVMCRQCGWTWGMFCSECAKGCGCEYDCTGWRHEEMRAATGDWDDDGYDRDACPECGAGGRNSNPYEDCQCYDDEEGEAA